MFRLNPKIVHEKYLQIRFLIFFCHCSQVSFHQFVLPIPLKAKEDVYITLVYENLLKKMENKYHHVISLSPGSTVSEKDVEHPFQVVKLKFNL